MNRLLDYYRLRRLGLSIDTAWRASANMRMTVVDYIVIVLSIIGITYLLYTSYEADRRFYYGSLLLDAAKSKISAERYRLASDRYQNVVIGCLNGRGIVIDGVYRECKVQPWRESLS